LKLDSLGEKVNTLINVQRVNINATNLKLVDNVQNLYTKIPLKNGEDLENFEEWLSHDDNYKILVSTGKVG